MDAAKLPQARDYALTGGGSGYITRHRRLVMAWGDPRARYVLKSTTKSFGSMALGLAIKDGKLRLEDKAVFKEIVWAPPETIVRRTTGSDNWPMTWADDDWLYTDSASVICDLLQGQVRGPCFDGRICMAT